MRGFREAFVLLFGSDFGGFLWESRRVCWFFVGNSCERASNGNSSSFFFGSLFKAFFVASSLGFVLHTLNAFASKFEFGDLFFY